MPGNPYHDDVILHVKMNGEENGVTFTDLSKYGRTITTNGNAKTTADNAYVNGSSGSFNGSTAYLSTNNLTGLFMPGDFTIEYFTRASGLSGYRPVIEARAAAAFQMFILGIWDGKIDFVHSSGRLTESTASMSINTWKHCATVRSGTTLMHFTEGVKHGTTGTLAGTITPAGAALYIGANIDGSRFSGLLADLRITKRALFTENFTPPNEGLPSGPIVFAGSGIAKFTDGAVAQMIRVHDRTTGDLIDEITPDPTSGAFSIESAQEVVDVVIFKSGYRPLTHGPITLIEQ